jgi:iron(III) transport system permease protein
LQSAYTLKAYALITGLALVMLSVLPLAYPLWASVQVEGGGLSLQAYYEVLSESRQWLLLRNSLLMALGSAFFATLLGLPAAFATEYLCVPSRGMLRYCIAASFLIPTYVLAIAWIDLFGAQSFVFRSITGATLDGPPSLKMSGLPGVIFINTLAYYPVVALTTGLALRRLDSRMVEAGALCATPLRTFGRITLPLIAPSVGFGALFVFVLSLLGFSVPSLLQVNVYTVEIYSRFNAYYDLAGAVAQAGPLVFTGLTAVAIWHFWLRAKREWLSGHRRQSRHQMKSGFVAWGLAVACWGLVGVAALLPIGVLFWRSLPMSSYVEIWRTARGEIGNSLLLAAGAATLLSVLALSLAYLTRRGRGRTLVTTVTLAGFLVSGPVLSVGLIQMWNHAGPLAMVYDSLLVVLFAFTGHFLFFGFQALGIVMNDLDRKMEEAALLAGVPWWSQLSKIYLPLCLPVLVGVWGLSFLFALSELDVTVLIAPPGWDTLSVRLFTLMHYGPSRLVAALSVVIVVMIQLSAVVTSLVYRYFAGRNHGRH